MTQLETKVSRALRAIRKIRESPARGVTPEHVDQVEEALSEEVQKTTTLLRERCAPERDFAFRGEGGA